MWIGAAVTSLLFGIGKLLIGLYIGKSAVASGFGAAGSLIVLLIWVYYSAQIFLLGAEFTWIYAHHAGPGRGVHCLSSRGSADSATAPFGVGVLLPVRSAEPYSRFRRWEYARWAARAILVLSVHQ